MLYMHTNLHFALYAILDKCSFACCCYAALQVEDAELQARARALLPLEQLRLESQEAADLNALLGEQQPAGSVLGRDDFLVQGLLAFFKRDFFTWVGGCGWQGSVVVGGGAAQQLGWGWAVVCCFLSCKLHVIVTAAAVQQCPLVADMTLLLA
eukprot:GHRQ01010819.1.p1 GENE.GHRQ01010819.1~~GHRQ01010819.1.p1  ORF type:complete len:153 (+),score=68.09 GHRQ01010819.1:653-1111(+)